MIWRYLLAFLLSLVVLITWPMIFPPPAPPPAPVAPPPAPGAARSGADPGAEPRAPGDVPEAERAAADRLEPAIDARPARPRSTFEAPLAPDVLATFDSLGGVLAGVTLADYTESVGDEEPYRLLYPLDGPGGTLTLELPDHDLPWENWSVEERPRASGGGVVFENETADGIHVRKSVLPLRRARGDGEAAPEGHHFIVRVEIENRSPATTQLRYLLTGPAGIDTESLQAPGSDVSLVFGRRAQKRILVTTEAASSLTDGAWELAARLAWVGIANNYFASILVPGAPGSAPVEFVDKAFARAFPDTEDVRRLAREKGLTLEELSLPQNAFLAQELRGQAFENLRVGLRTHSFSVEPGARVVHDYTLFAGPREREVLARYSELAFDGVNDYGVFGLVNMFIRLLEFLKTIAFGSWGVAIILLTFLVKLCLHPINKRSQASMQRFQKKMQKIKPEMDALKERHGDNRMKLNQDMQRLWKEHGINPGQQLGGCLVLFLQLPIWFALYTTLRYAIGLRQESFLYIDDLTKPDQLFPFGMELPFLGAWFNLLPVLYVILTLVNQRLQPKPEDPQMRAQFRMMSFMMVFFGFIFYQFPAGFMLYIMTSSALGILESKIIKAEIAREDGDNGALSVAGAPPSGDGTHGVPATAAPYPARGKSEGRSASPARDPKRAKGKRRR